MDLGTLVKLQTAADQAPMQYMGELTSALSDTIRNRNARSMEQDAMRFFSDGNVSMDKIQQFQQMYPGVPAVEVMKQAATIGTQVEAQAMKDMYNTVGSIIQENGGKLDPKAFSESMLKFTPQQRQQFMKLTVANPNFLKQFSVTRSQEDETKRTVETDALGNVTKEIKGTPIKPKPVMVKAFNKRLGVKGVEFDEETFKQISAKDPEWQPGEPLEEKDPTRISLVKMATAGDKNAQAILDELDRREQTNRAAGKTTVSNTVQVGDKAMTKLGEKMSEVLVEQRKDVEGAVTALNNTKEASKLIDSGMITGTGAEYLVNMGNFLSSRLGFKKFDDPVANTQAYAATMGNQVGQIIKQFGSGTGLSDADREYAEKIVGGKITLNEMAIRKLLAINKKAYENVIRSYNKKADEAMKKPGSESLPYDLRVPYDFTDKSPSASGSKKIGRFNVEVEGNP